MTYAMVKLEVSRAAYAEIRTKLVEAGYEHSFADDDEHGELIDMHGLALVAIPATTIRPDGPALHSQE